MARRDLREIVDDPYVLFGVSDGGAHTKFLTAGRYPDRDARAGGPRARDDLAGGGPLAAVAPAGALAGFRDRGVLRSGAPADIVVYDFDHLAVLDDEIVHDLPGGEWRRIQRARGYRWVLVNGEVTIGDDQQTGTFPAGCCATAARQPAAVA